MSKVNSSLDVVGCGPETSGENPEAQKSERWSRILRQPAKVDSPMQRTNHHEDAETVFG